MPCLVIVFTCYKKELSLEPYQLIPSMCYNAIKITISALYQCTSTGPKKQTVDCIMEYIYPQYSPFVTIFKQTNV